MRKLIFIGFVAAGMALALLFGIKEDWGTRLVLMLFGAVAGGAVGGALSGIGRRPKRKPSSEIDALRGHGTADEDRMDNYWRDEDHPPFMNPASPDIKTHGGTGGMLE